MLAVASRPACCRTLPVLSSRATIRSRLPAPKATSDDKVVADAEKAASEAQVKADKALKDVGQMWEDVEEKPAAISLTLAILVGLYALNGVVTSVDHIPVVSGVFELVGVFVSAWFVYRYLIFGPDRQELKEELNTFFSKVKGDK